MKFGGRAGPGMVLRGKPRWSQRMQAAVVQGPGRSRYGIEREAMMVTVDARQLAKVQGPVRSRNGVDREAAMVTVEARQLAKVQGPVRSRYGVEKEAVMVTADSKMSRFAPCKNLFL